MADVTIHRTGELLKILFELLMEKPNGMKAKEALTALKEKVDLTEYEKGEYSSGGGLRECFLSGRIRLENDQIQPNLPDRPQVYRMAND